MPDDCYSSMAELGRINESRGLGCVVLDDRHRVTWMAPLARRLLDRGGLRVAADRALETEYPHQQSVLHGAFADARRQRGRRAPRLALRREGAPTPLIATISTVALHDRLDAAAPAKAAGNAAFMLLLRDPSWMADNGCEQLVSLLGLTRRESELACHLARGGTLAEFGERHDLSHNTVKSHLKQAFRKLGVRSQVQLVTRVLALLH